MHATDRKMLRQFGLIMGLAFVVFFGLLLPWLWERRFPVWPWVAGLVFWGTGAFVPMILAPVYHIWMKIGHVLGWINTRIVLGLCFWVIFVPISLVFRVLGKDPMHRKFDSGRGSYRVVSNCSSPEQMEKPF